MAFSLLHSRHVAKLHRFLPLAYYSYSHCVRQAITIIIIIIIIIITTTTINAIKPKKFEVYNYRKKSNYLPLNYIDNNEEIKTTTFIWFSASSLHNKCELLSTTNGSDSPPTNGTIYNDLASYYLQTPLNVLYFHCYPSIGHLSFSESLQQT